MTINWWTIGLQAINVLILVWLLSRLFWRPIAAAIAQRQRVVASVMADADKAKAEAEAAASEIAQTRAGFAAERQALLDEARATAETMSKATLNEARMQAEKISQAAQRNAAADAQAARAAGDTYSAQLAISIARKLLSGLDQAALQAIFLDQFITAIQTMSEPDQNALTAIDATGKAPDLVIVCASDPDTASKDRITKAFETILGVSPDLSFQTEPDLVAGFELRSAHFVLHNNWRSDLELIEKALIREASSNAD